MDFPITLLLADDDNDDCLLFSEALEELPILTNLTIVNDGERLLKLLNENNADLPAVIFLDFNMPRKNGLECLRQIKLIDKLKSIPVIIYSTYLDSTMINLVYQTGAQYYVRKPAEFSNLKQIIHQVLLLITQSVISQPVEEKFILQV